MRVYFVSRQGYQEGPHSLEIIEDKIRSKYYAETDYIYNAKSGEWVWLSKFEPTAEVFSSIKNELKQDDRGKAKGYANDNQSDIWYLLKGQNQFGPFHFQEIVTKLINKEAFEYDFVWSPGMMTWKKVSECNQFHESNLLPLVKKVKGSSPHFRRKNERYEHGASLVLHNYKKLWNGKSFELSSSGGSVVIEGNSFNKGEIVLIHYRPSRMVPAFNVQCEVINCQKIEPTNNVDQFRVGLRFVKINEMAQSAIKHIAHQKIAS